MGGFVGYYLANTLGICALLYNPALPYRGTIIQKTPALFPVKHAPLMRIVLGGQDTIIKAKDNLAYFSQNIIPNSDYSIVLRNDLAHQIPIEVFEDETKAFFSSALIVLLSLD